MCSLPIDTVFMKCKKFLQWQEVSLRVIGTSVSTWLWKVLWLDQQEG